MPKTVTNNYQFFSLSSTQRARTLWHQGKQLARISPRRTSCLPEALEVIPVLSGHLTQRPEITPFYQALGLQLKPAELESADLTRELLHFSLEYSLTDKPPLVNLSEIALVNRTLQQCPPEISSFIKKDFLGWLAWLKWRFNGELGQDDFKQFVNLLPYFQGRGFTYFRELATITTAIYQDQSQPLLVQLARWFSDLSETVHPAERDSILEKIILERNPPSEVANHQPAFLANVCQEMKAKNWGGYVLQNIHEAAQNSLGLNYPINSISLILSHCMIGLGDMALFLALTKAFKKNYPDRKISGYLFQEQDRPKLETLWPNPKTLGNQFLFGLNDQIQSQITTSDLAVYVTAPWSYQNGHNPVMAGPKARTTVYLPGLDWNRTQGFIRQYPNGQIEMMLPFGFSPYVLAGPLDIFSASRPAAPVQKTAQIPQQFAGYLKGLVYTSYDPTIFKAALHFLEQMKKTCERFVYFIFIRQEDFPPEFLERFAADCQKQGILFCDSDSLPKEPQPPYLLVDLGPLPQARFNDLLETTDLPSLITGTATVCQFLERGKPFVHLGNHPNARTLKQAFENSVFIAYQKNHISVEEYHLLTEYFNLFMYRYQNPAEPFILTEFDPSRFRTPEFNRGFQKWLSFLKSAEFSFFKKLERLLPLTNQPASSAELIEINPGTPTFETVYDNQATTIWNQFRYGVFYLKLTAKQALARVLEQNSLDQIERACRKLKGNPYRQRFNDLLAGALKQDTGGKFSLD